MNSLIIFFRTKLNKKTFIFNHNFLIQFQIKALLKREYLSYRQSSTTSLKSDYKTHGENLFGAPNVLLSK